MKRWRQERERGRKREREKEREKERERGREREKEREREREREREKCIYSLLTIQYSGGADFLSIPGQRFTFTPQNTRFPFAIAIVNDNDIEGTERFITTVTTDTDDFPGVTLNPDEVVIDILDNDGEFINPQRSDW